MSQLPFVIPCESSRAVKAQPRCGLWLGGAWVGGPERDGWRQGRVRPRWCGAGEGVERKGLPGGKARLRCSPGSVGRILATCCLPHPCASQWPRVHPGLGAGGGAAPQTQSKTAGDGGPQALNVSQVCARAGSPKNQLLHPKDLHTGTIGEKRPVSPLRSAHCGFLTRCEAPHQPPVAGAGGCAGPRSVLPCFPFLM